MNSSLWKPWLIATFSVAVAGLVIRAIWQVVVIPTADTMVIFIPLVLALVGVDLLVVYIVLKPERLTNLFSLILISVALTAGLIAGVTHFVNFIISPLADPFWSKVVSSCILASSLSTYFLILWFFWSLRQKRQSDG
jgi:hypothetical protein